MLAADHRVIKQVKPMTGANAGLTPMLMGRTLDKDAGSKPTAFDSLLKKPDLKEIREEKEEADAVEAKAQKSKASAAKNALKGL